MVWNRQRLLEMIERRLRGCRFIAVSNREPYLHRFRGDEVECFRPASGLTAALDPVMKACGGTWVAHGSGNADRISADAGGKLAVPPEDPRYTLRRVWLSKDQEDGYYYGLANEGLWPLCHIVFAPPRFDAENWACYRRVNETFAQAVVQEAGQESAVVFIHDYHFGLLPRMLRQGAGNLLIAHFWHIPWPNRETFRAFPWGEEMLDGLLGNDLLGFHLRYHCQNFLDTVDRSIEARVNPERFEVSRRGKKTLVLPFPISIDFETHSAAARAAPVVEEMERWRRQLGLQGRVVGIGVDRIDYTKGIPDRLRAIDLFLERNENYRGRLVFVQVGVPSRTRIPRYQRLSDEIQSLVEEINWKWSNDSWIPLVFLKEHVETRRLMALHRLADFCMVTSLHDGMNLVAKEFVASRVDDEGVLILSRFTGAARELVEALLVNPFSLEEMVEAIGRALAMPPEERRWRMNKMRETVAVHNIYRWAGKIISRLLSIGFPERRRVSRAGSGL